jgi:hypothetical protein
MVVLGHPYFVLEMNPIVQPEFRKEHYTIIFGLYAMVEDDDDSEEEMPLELGSWA